MLECIYNTRSPGFRPAAPCDIASTLGDSLRRPAGNNPVAYAVAGMAAFFTAVVRAPVTGIILVIELTASDTQLLSMIAACFSAMLVPTLLRNPPIYDSLGEPLSAR